jgi:ABC-2 type transport system permease protein
MAERAQAWLIPLRIARRDLLDLWRAKMLLFAFLLMPILLMSMFGYMFPPTPLANQFTQSVPTAYPNLPVAIVLTDSGQQAYDVATSFIQISQSRSLFIVSEAPNFNSARDELVRGELSGIVVFPEGFSDSLKGGQQALVQVTVDQTNPQIASVVSGEISTVFSMISSDMAMQNVEKMMRNNASVNPEFVLEPISTNGEPLIAVNSSSFQFLAPGFMALTVVFGALSGVGFAISREREQGTMDGLLVAPIPSTSVIAGKIISQTVRGMIQGFLILGLAMAVFGVRIYGNPIIMVVVMLLGVASFVGVGIILTSIAPEQETAQMLVILLQFPMMFLSGIIFPISQLPGWMQWVGKAMPLYYAADALRKVMILNVGFDVIGGDLAILVVYSIFTMFAAVPVFKRAMTR